MSYFNHFTMANLLLGYVSLDGCVGVFILGNGVHWLI